MTPEQILALLTVMANLQMALSGLEQENIRLRRALEQQQPAAGSSA